MSTGKGAARTHAASIPGNSTGIATPLLYAPIRQLAIPPRASLGVARGHEEGEGAVGLLAGLEAAPRQEVFVKDAGVQRRALARQLFWGTERGGRGSVRGWGCRRCICCSGLQSSGHAIAQALREKVKKPAGPIHLHPHVCVDLGLGIKVGDGVLAAQRGAQPRQRGPRVLQRASGERGGEGQARGWKGRGWDLLAGEGRRQVVCRHSV